MAVNDLKARLEARDLAIFHEAKLRIEVLEKQVEDLQFRLDAALKGQEENQHGK